MKLNIKLQKEEFSVLILTAYSDHGFHDLLVDGIITVPPISRQPGF